MGFLKVFSASPLPLKTLPSGSFTVDRNGQIVVSTLPQAFPKALLREIADRVLKTWRGAQEAQLPLSELVVRYSGFKLTARNMRGGAMVFLTPLTPLDPTK
jgi:hypothetical protein